jgi:hypothetical protein
MLRDPSHKKCNEDPRHILQFCHGKDGRDGKRGIPGPPGPRGPRGRLGKDGKDGKQGLQGNQGKQGKQGEHGEHGHPGKRGPPGINGNSSALGSAFLWSVSNQPKISTYLQFQEVQFEQNQFNIGSNWRSVNGLNCEWSTTDSGQYIITYRVGIRPNLTDPTILSVRMATILTQNNAVVPGSQVVTMTSVIGEYTQLSTTVPINYSAGDILSLQWWCTGYLSPTSIAVPSPITTGISIGFNPTSLETPLIPIMTNPGGVFVRETTASMMILRILLP